MLCASSPQEEDEGGLLTAGGVPAAATAAAVPRAVPVPGPLPGLFLCRAGPGSGPFPGLFPCGAGPGAVRGRSRGYSRAGPVPGLFGAVPGAVRGRGWSRSSSPDLSRGPVSPQPLLERHLVGAGRQHGQRSALRSRRPPGGVSQGRRVRGVLGVPKSPAMRNGADTSSCTQKGKI